MSRRPADRVKIGTEAGHRERLSSALLVLAGSLALAIALLGLLWIMLFRI
ncbi:MAG: hypothetical protein V7634_2695 [Bradyrhizobium sp.]|jgi:hypothetical protein